MKPHEHVIMEIARERERQMTQEGWTPEHDDRHSDGELARAAAGYALNAGTERWVKLMRSASADNPPAWWPWPDWWKPKNPRRDLVRAAAMIVAEIERLDRAANQQG